MDNKCKTIIFSVILFVLLIFLPLYFLIMRSIRKDAQMCGGFAGLSCSTGYTCKYEGNFPDASGKCIFILDVYGLLVKPKFN
jgi:hypothetical protein